MRARSTTIRGDPRSIDEGVAYLRDVALPAMQQMDGFIGPSVLAERLTGRCIVTSAWTDPQALHASDARIRPMREEMARRFGGPVEVQDWDVVVLHGTGGIAAYKSVETLMAADGIGRDVTGLELDEFPKDVAPNVGN